VIDSPMLNEIGKLLRITANNVNQIAARVNCGGEAYRNDIAEIDEKLTECRTLFGKIMAKLAKY